MFAILAILTVTVVTGLYILLGYVYTYWKRQGFPYAEPMFFFGNLSDVMSRKVSFSIHMFEMYKKSTASFVQGVYFFFTPALLVTNAEVAMRMLTQDFGSFQDRGTFHNPTVDPLSAHLLNMPYIEWKAMRAKLTPTFTTGKLKSMMSSILVEGENLKQYLQSSAEKREVVHFKHLLDRYALNIIASVGFGMDVDTIKDPNHEFTNVEKIVNGPGLITSLRLLLAFLCPSVLIFFNTYAHPLEARKYFTRLVTDTFAYREKNNVIRKDFMQLLMQLRNSGKVSEDDDWSVRKSEGSMSLTINDCAAQTYLFYLAGFDTSSSALTYCLYELVRNPELLVKVQKEIDETLSRHNEEVTYEAIQEMNYLELCILETVRKYPTLPLLNRYCTKDYAVPKSDLTIPKGTPIIISLLGLSRDARYFPEPERFWPERFEENVMQYDKNAFIPFGEGPRMCIGLRLGKMIAKVGLVQLLRSYDFEAVQTGEIEFQHFSLTLVPKGGIEMRVVKRANRA